MFAVTHQHSLPTALGRSDYWHESRRPLTSLVFVLPLLFLYEGGVLLLGPSAVRNGADVWLRTLLDWLGFGQYFLLPVLTIGALLAWHHTRREPWQVRPRVLHRMLLESLALALVLLVVAHVQGALLMRWEMSAPLVALELPVGQWLARLVSFFGAGIYEEVLFRLLMLPGIAALIAFCGVAPRMRIVSAVLLTSLLFSLVHVHVSLFGRRLLRGTLCLSRLRHHRRDTRAVRYLRRRLLSDSAFDHKC